MMMKAQSLLLDGTNHMTSNLNMYGHSDNNYIPKNSELDMTGNKIVNLAAGVSVNDGVNKAQLDNVIATIHTKGKDIVLQDKYSVINMKNYGYPTHGNLNKAISYANMRDIFLSKREGDKMFQPIDMNNNLVENLKTPTERDHATNKSYVDDNFLNKNGGVISGNLDMSGND